MQLFNVDETRCPNSTILIKSREMYKTATAKSVRQHANHRERQVLDHLRKGSWIYLCKLPVPVGKRLIGSLVAKKWVELRISDSGIRITAIGVAAVTAPVPTIY